MPVVIRSEESVTRRGPSIELLESIGQTEPVLQALARKGFHTFGLRTYLTAGPKELRAWTTTRATPHRRPLAPPSTPTSSVALHQGRGRALRRPDGGGVEGSAKAAGKVRMEGKDDVMHDRAVVEFRFNV